VIVWERFMREIEKAQHSNVRRRLAALSNLLLKSSPHDQPVRRLDTCCLQADAAKPLKTPAEDTIEGLRDRAILSVGLQVSLRREEIATLTVKSQSQRAGVPPPHGPRRHRPRTAQACRCHRADRGYSTHSMRATFITTALENGATLDDVQRAAGHSEPSTTKLYDRRGYNPEKSASFFATY
jgi:site-specific recombinase XerD